MLFAENVEEQGSGKESLVTNDMYPKIIGFKKKWRELKFLASANTFFCVLNETAHLSYLIEGDTAMIYQIQEAVDDVILNLKDIAEEKDTPLFLANVKLIKETEESNVITVSVSASNVPENKLKKIRESKSSNEPKVTFVKANFVLHNVKQGKEKVETIKSNLITAIISNIESRFENLKSCEEFEALKLFDVSKWTFGQDTKSLIQLDHDHIDVIAERFEKSLAIYKFNFKEAKKEWKKVTYCFVFIILFFYYCAFKLSTLTPMFFCSFLDIRKAHYSTSEIKRPWD